MKQRKRLKTDRLSELEENLKLSRGGPSQRQASGTNQRFKDRTVNESEA